MIAKVKYEQLIIIFVVYNPFFILNNFLKGLFWIHEHKEDGNIQHMSVKR